MDTPTYNPTEKVDNAFKIYCQKVLPLAFDESMSYYETLCALTQKIYDMINALNNNADSITELQNLYTQLQQYVDNYFDNLDVQEEINNKLDNMALNGLFDQYFAPILQEVNDVKTNYRNKNVLIGMGDLTQEVKEALTGGSTAVVGINSVNTENIVDKAVTYRKTANNLLMSQDLRFSPENYNAKNILYDLPVINKSINSETGFTSNDETGTQLATILPISPNGNMSFNNLYTPTSQLNYAVYKYVRASKPSNIFNWTANLLEAGSISQANGNIVNNMSYVRTKDFITLNQETRFYIDQVVATMFVFKYNKSDDTFVSSQQINDITIPVDDYKYKFVITYGDTSIFKFNNTDSSIPLLVQRITNNFYTFIETVVNTYHNQLSIPYDPQYVYNFRFNIVDPNNTANRLPIPYTTTDYNNYMIVADRVKFKDDTIINKRFSVIGDSYSAYAGIIPSRNNPYYNGSNAGVSSPNQMWWQKLVNDYGCQRLVIEAWSGSSVSNIGASSTNVPMSDTSRCQALDTSGMIPEMIIIMGGTNDFSHANPNIGTYNGTQSFPTTNNDFRSAYALMLQRIREKYPLADVFCCSLPLFVRVPENKNVPQRNGEPETVTNYNKAIMEIASLMNAHYIDLNETGFTPTNYYPTYCQDSSTRPTHPNSAGQQVIANVIANNLIEFYYKKSTKST